MFDFVAIFESIKRHWMWVLLVTALCVCTGAALSLVKDGSIETEPQYTAEATLYFNAYASDAVEDFNYRVDDNLLATDVRRAVISKEVAGEVRNKLGEEVKISSPFWINEKTNGNFATRFIFVDATANNADLAVEAANLAAEKTTQVVRDTLPITKVEITSPASLKVTGLNKAADFGTEKIVTSSVDAPVTAGSGVSLKNILIYGFAGLFVSVLAFVLYDIISRKIRSPHDIERLLDVPVIAVCSGVDDAGLVGEDIRVLLRNNELDTMIVVGFASQDEPEQWALRLKSCMGDMVIGGVVAPLAGSVARIAEASSVVLSVRQGAATGSEIRRAIEKLKIAGTPILGAVFVTKQKRSKKG